MGQLKLEFLVFDDATLDGVRQEHRTWAQPALAHHSGGIHIKNANLAGENN